MSEKVAVLYRVSTSRQAKRDEQDDLPLQIQMISDYATENNMTVVREYREAAISAYHTDADDRKMLKAILRDAALGQFKTLLVFHSNRLSRRSMDYPMYLYQLRKRGVKVISVSENKELTIDSHNDKLIRFLEGWQAEGESLNKSIHVSAYMREKAKQGKYLGGRPAYGFKYDHKTKAFEVNEEEAEVLRYAFSRIFDVGAVQISKELNAMGKRTRLGKPWGSGVLGRIMRNPLVAGLRAYGRSRPTGRGKNRTKTDCTNFDEFIIPRDKQGNPKPDPNLAIVPLDAWLAAMEVMKKRRPRGTPKTPYGLNGRSISQGLLLTGFARCAECGAGLITYRSYRTSRSGRVVEAGYQCRTQYESGKSVCKGQRYFAENKINSLFLAELEAFLGNLDPKGLLIHFEEELNKAKIDAGKQIREAERDYTNSRRLLEEWLQRLDKYLLDPSSSLYSEEIIAQKVREYEDRVRAAESRLVALRRRMSAKTAEKRQLEMFAKLVPDWFSIFKEAPLPQQKQMLKTIIDTVEIGKNTFTINCKLNIMEFMRSAGAETSSESTLVLPFRLVSSNR